MKFCKCGIKIFKTSINCRSCESKRRHKIGLCKYFSGIKAPGYKDGRSLKKYFCLDCKKRLGKFAYEGTKRCRTCYQKWIKNPKNHPNWQGGISFEPYSPDWTKQLKKFIIKRDSNQCQLCHKTQKQEIKQMKNKLTVHHIDYNKKNCKESNLISLCKRCNSKVNFNRNYWYAYFRYILKEIL